MNDLNHAWEMGYGWIVGIILLVIIVVLVIVVVSQKKSNRRIKDSSPMDIIKARFARGEISKEEFEEKRKSLL